MFMTQNLTPEEISQLKEIQIKRNKLIEQFGHIEFTIQELELQKKYLISELNSLKQNEIETGNSLETKYGQGIINIDKGEFTQS